MKLIAYAVGVMCWFFSFASCHASVGHLLLQKPGSKSKVITYEAKNGYGVVEGDILIGKLLQLQEQHAVIRTKLGGYRWKNNTVAFKLDKELPAANKIAVLMAIVYWQNYSNLKFVELTDANKDKYRDYILFKPAPGTTCSSFVGRQGGEQEIELAPRCNQMNTVHEIGHALGMWHEQSRADRDQHIRINWENIEEPHKHNFEQEIYESEDFGEYDYGSIMHYSSYAFSKNGEPTIVPLVNGVEIGQREKLSDGDIAAVAAMYPLP